MLGLMEHSASYLCLMPTASAMKVVTLSVPEKEYSFLMKLLKSLGFVTVERVDEGDSKEAITQNLKRGFEEMKQFKAGTKKGTPLKDFLHEL